MAEFFRLDDEKKRKVKEYTVLIDNGQSTEDYVRGCDFTKEDLRVRNLFLSYGEEKRLEVLETHRRYGCFYLMAKCEWGTLTNWHTYVHLVKRSRHASFFMSEVQTLLSQRKKKAKLSGATGLDRGSLANLKAVRNWMTGCVRLHTCVRQLATGLSKKMNSQADTVLKLTRKGTGRWEPYLRLEASDVFDEITDEEDEAWEVEVNAGILSIPVLRSKYQQICLRRREAKLIQLASRISKTGLTPVIAPPRVAFDSKARNEMALNIYEMTDRLEAALPRIMVGDHQSVPLLEWAASPFTQACPSKMVVDLTMSRSNTSSARSIFPGMGSLVISPLEDGKRGVLSDSVQAQPHIKDREKSMKRRHSRAEEIFSQQDLNVPNDSEELQTGQPVEVMDPAPVSSSLTQVVSVVGTDLRRSRRIRSSKSKEEKQEGLATTRGSSASHFEQEPTTKENLHRDSPTHTLMEVCGDQSESEND